MDKKIFNVICRNDFKTFTVKSFYEIDGSQEFADNWHIDLLCDTLQQCAEGKIKRLIINIPPRSLKTHCASICLPAYILGHNPSERIIRVGYSQDYINQSSRKIRQLIETPTYKSIFNTCLGEKNAEGEFDTTQNGYCYSTSVGGSLTGIGGNYIIIDDPIKANDALSPTIRKNVNDWFSNTLISRLNNKITGCVILIMQRLHVDDLTGYLLNQGGWELLSLPAIAEEDEKFVLSTGKIVGRKKGEALNPKLEPIEIIEQNKLIMSAHDFSAQYQQNPIPEKGNIIRFDDFKTYNENELPSEGVIFQSWDIALKDGVNNDYSVCITAKQVYNLLYIMDIWRGKMELNDLVNKIHSMYYDFNAAHVIIEDSPVSSHTIQFVRAQGEISPYTYATKGICKSTRANGAGYYMREGRVLIPDKAYWLTDFRNEINSFPFGKHDDQVDALSQLTAVVFNRKMDLNDIAEAIKRSNSIMIKNDISQFNSAEELCKYLKSKISKNWYNWPKK